MLQWHTPAPAIMFGLVLVSDPKIIREHATTRKWLYTYMHLGPPVYPYRGSWIKHELEPSVAMQRLYSCFPAVPHNLAYTTPCVHSCSSDFAMCHCNSCQIKATSSVGTWWGLMKLSLGLGTKCRKLSAILTKVQVTIACMHLCYSINYDCKCLNMVTMCK